jgi:hypothetical protein
MEYAIGSIITLITVLAINWVVQKNPPQISRQIKYNQSHIHNLIKPFMPSNEELQEPKITQATKHLDSISIKIVFIKNKAYWIKDNVLHMALVKDDVIQHETTIKVDTINMDKVQLNEIILVVEKLTRG